MIPFPHPMFGRTGSVTYAATNWLYAGSAGVISLGETPWSNSGNITAGGTARATFLSSGGGVTDYLRGSNFNFTGESIPSGAVITGMEAEILRYAGASNGPRDLEVILADYTDFSPLSLNRASSASWPTTETARTYGGENDTWGLSLTKAMIESSDFALLLRAQYSGAQAGAVNSFRLRAHYYY